MTAADSTRSQLLRAVLEEPFEDTIRLVYADELEENGERERAEFIRDNLSRESYEIDLGGPGMHLFARDHKTILIEMPATVHGIIRRGFIDEIRLPAAAFLEHAAALFAAHPITKVVLVGVKPWVPYGGGDRTTLATYAIGEEDLSSVTPAVLDPFISNFVDERNHHIGHRGEWWQFSNDAAALDVLSRACVNYGRSLVGLRPLYART